MTDPIDNPFCVQVQWEHASYPAHADSLARALVTLEAAGCNPETVPTHLVMVLDISGSMLPPDKYPLVRDAVSTLIQGLEDGMFLTLVLFSSQAECVCRSIPAAEARARCADLIRAMDQSPMRFHGTNLAHGLCLATDAVRAFRAARPDIVPRIYVLTDGQLGDEMVCLRLTPELEQLRVEINSYGFGADFALHSLRRIFGSCPGGAIKHIRDTRDVRETFQRILAVTSLIVASEAELEIEFSSGVVAGDVFSHRPAPRLWSASAFSGQPRIEIGNLEAGRPYVWALECRLPDGVGADFDLGELRLRCQHKGSRTMTWPLEVPIASGSELGPSDERVKQVFLALEDLRDNDPAARVAAYEARIAICREEGRDPAYLEALEQVLAHLRGEGHAEHPSDEVWRAAEADPSTMVGY